MSTEQDASAVEVFLSSVYRATETTGLRPRRNIISRALFDRIVDETCITRSMTDPLPIGPHKGHGQIMGYPVRVIESPLLFALSLDQEEL